MRIKTLEPSPHVQGRVLVTLEDGSFYKITEQEILDFSLAPGVDLSGEELERLKAAAGASQARLLAAQIIGHKPLSRSELIRKLRDKGCRTQDAQSAADWLTEIGALDESAYAAMLVRHYGAMRYGPAKVREELRTRGVPRELWEEALAQLPPAEESISAFLDKKLSDRPIDRQELHRLAAALQRRGFAWGDISACLCRYGADPEE